MHIKNHAKSLTTYEHDKYIILTQTQRQIKAMQSYSNGERTVAIIKRDNSISQGTLKINHSYKIGEST